MAVAGVLKITTLVNNLRGGINSEKTFRSWVAVHVKLEFRQSKYGLRY